MCLVLDSHFNYTCQHGNQISSLNMLRADAKKSSDREDNFQFGKPYTTLIEKPDFPLAQIDEDKPTQFSFFVQQNDGVPVEMDIMPNIVFQFTMRWIHLGILYATRVVIPFFGLIWALSFFLVGGFGTVKLEVRQRHSTILFGACGWGRKNRCPPGDSPSAQKK